MHTDFVYTILLSWKRTFVTLFYSKMFLKIIVGYVQNKHSWTKNNTNFWTMLIKSREVTVQEEADVKKWIIKKLSATKQIGIFMQVKKIN